MVRPRYRSMIIFVLCVLVDGSSSCYVRMCTLIFTLSIGFYFTQDYAYRDIDGDYQIQGRKDDIIRVKGVWLQVPEIESNIVRRY